MNRREIWDERYRRGETSGKTPEPVLVSAVQSEVAGRALDLACCLGRSTLLLAERGWQVVAVDYSQAALRELAARSAGLPVQIIEADLELGEFQITPNSFDLICDCLYLQRPLWPANKTGIRPGGLFVGVFPLFDPESAVPMSRAFLMDRGELRELFDDWHIEHYSEDPPAADGKRCRARIVARKPVSAELA
ncbi:MAG TPA: methyltransferase domain-containing protein [Bryobacteraceae bacterium]|nr:methyltransferase domain-containing protein [Bryobacteraceae bacterium]